MSSTPSPGPSQSPLVESIRKRQKQRDYTSKRRTVQRRLEFSGAAGAGAGSDDGGGAGSGDGGGADAAAAAAPVAAAAAAPVASAGAEAAEASPDLNLSPGISRIFQHIDEALGEEDGIDALQSISSAQLRQLKRNVRLEEYREKWDAWFNGNEMAIGLNLQLLDASLVGDLRTELRKEFKAFIEKYRDPGKPVGDIDTAFEAIKTFASTYTKDAQERAQSNLRNMQNARPTAPVQRQLTTRELIGAVSTHENKENILFEQVNAAVKHDSEYLGAEDLYLILEEQLEENPANPDRSVHLTMVRNYLVNKIGKIGEQIAQTQGPEKHTEIRALMASRKVLVDKFERFSGMLAAEGAGAATSERGGAATDAAGGQLRVGGIYVEFC